jgi:hypothetical protein
MKVKLFTSVTVAAVALAASALSGTAKAITWEAGDRSVDGYVLFRAPYDNWNGHLGYFQCGPSYLKMSNSSFLDVYPEPGHAGSIQTVNVKPAFYWWNGNTWVFYGYGPPMTATQQARGQDLVFAAGTYYPPSGYYWHMKFAVQWKVGSVQVAQALYSMNNDRYEYDWQHWGTGSCYVS